MTESECKNCGLRKKYEENPKSIVGRVWRWHINFCPGWKKYYLSLSKEKQFELSRRYNFNKFDKIVGS